MVDWFAPKRFGLGAGLPIAWQGWAVLGTYLAALAACLWLLGGDNSAALAIMLPVTALMIVITWRTTRGGWRWRWGTED